MDPKREERDIGVSATSRYALADERDALEHVTAGRFRLGDTIVGTRISEELFASDPSPS